MEEIKKTVTDILHKNVFPFWDLDITFYYIKLEDIVKYKKYTDDKFIEILKETIGEYLIIDPDISSKQINDYYLKLKKNYIGQLLFLPSEEWKNVLIFYVGNDVRGNRCVYFDDTDIYKKNFEIFEKKKIKYDEEQKKANIQSLEMRIALYKKEYNDGVKEYID